jgi:hypothetical protein
MYEQKKGIGLMFGETKKDKGDGEDILNYTTEQFAENYEDTC